MLPRSVLDSPLFRGLADAHVEAIAGGLAQERFAAGELIIRQGDHGDSLFLIEAGAVEVFLTSQQGEDVVLARLGPGEAFGEMSLLTGEPRSAGVRAVVPLTVRVARREDFLRLAVNQPVLLFNLSRVLVGRLSRASRAAARVRDSGVVAVIGDVPKLLGSLIATNLTAALSVTTHRRCMLVDVSADRACHLDGRDSAPRLRDVIHSDREVVVRPFVFGTSRFKTATLESGGFHESIAPLMPGEAIEWMRSAADYVVINLTGEPPEHLRALLPFVDRTYALTPSSQLVVGRRLVDEACGTDELSRRRMYPVLLTSGASSPLALRRGALEALGMPARLLLPGTAQLLRDAAQEQAPQVISAPHLPLSAGCMWLARDVARLKVGLALGAGGARGFAHVGAIRFLEESGVPNDYIAGTSMGAVIGATRALGLDIVQGTEAMHRLQQKFTSMIRFTFNVFSGILNPRGVEDTYAELVGDARIEELPIPFAAVATDLETARSIVMTEGPVADAIRASSAIPMMWPPKIIDDLCLVDGGVLNPVPTQVVRDMGADVVVAVDLSGRGDGTEQRPTQSAKGANFVQNALRCVDIMTGDRAVRDCLLADVVIRPRFQRTSWKEFERYEEHLQAGYAAAVESEPELRKLLPWMARGDRL
ncbi:MAG: cyclic nucleotide-binding domain-containing protein [Chloroflexota bacterium]